VACGTYRGPLGRLVRAAKYRPSTALLGLATGWVFGLI
jgi:hypothetical protein